MHRAIAEVVKEIIPLNSHVYELSSRGALFKFLKKRFKNITFSEYFDDVKPGQYKNGIMCQDVQALTFDDNSFDWITSTEVFEHVPDDIQGFKECYRVIRSGGGMIFTVPLDLSRKTITRAILKNGEIMHLSPPEYHGDRIRGQNKVLAFRNYGFDIKERIELCGFKCEIRLVPLKNDEVSTQPIVIAKK